MRYEVKLALIAALGGTMSLCLFLYGWKNREPVNFLNRPESGLGAQTQNLEVWMAGKRHDISVSLMEIPWEKEQAQEQLGRAAEELEKIVLNDNEDLEHIRKDMDMPSNVPGTKIAIQWYLDSWEYVSPGGSVKNAGMSGPCEVNIQAVLILGEEELVWEKTARICPPENPDEEQRLQILSVQLQKLQEESRDRTLILPTVIQGEHIAWYLPMDDRWMWFLLLTAAACMAIVIGHRQEVERLQKMRDRSMQLGYPEIVSRLSLYMNAGVSTRRAWERIVENYEKKSSEKQRYRETYEEMRTTLHEMQSGVPETLAYERFGARCCLPAYLKLGTLLSQNLRKGTKNLAGLLSEESREAFEDRKAFAKKLGEECESKLLLPMLMLLLIVLIMVMYPAVVSFQM